MLVFHLNKKCKAECLWNFIRSDYMHDACKFKLYHPYGKVIMSVTCLNVNLKAGR